MEYGHGVGALGHDVEKLVLDGRLEDDGEDESGDQGGDGAEDGVAAALRLGLQGQHEHHHQDCYDHLSTISRIF